MRILFLIPLIGLLSSCSNQNEGWAEAREQNIPDTVVIVETMVDTIYVDSSKGDSYLNSDYYILERLPDTLLRNRTFYAFVFEDTNEYEVEHRMNPLYLEADFNGDGHLDIALPIRQKTTEKVGFAIMHGQTSEIHILGAGTAIKNGLSDDMYYIDIWKVNRYRINTPGVEETTGTGENGELILENPSLQIEASEVGGGQIYWNGNEYAYFHQTC